jgi:hypothetical protein
MPYTMRKVRNRRCYRVSKKNAKKNTKRRVFSKCTSRKKAIKQMRLLRALENNPDFVPNAKRNNE